MTYTWKSFNLSDALNGALVGMPTGAPQPGGTSSEDITDISKVAGNLSKTDVNSRYKLVINGKTAVLDAEGTVVSSIPSGSYTQGTQMYIATAVITSTVGTTVTRSEGSETEYDDQVTLSVMEPRDEFAIRILSSMLVHAGKPETFDDANIRMFSNAAYRWAQGMMDAAANTRHGHSSGQSQDMITINSNDMQSNTEKLLYNIAVALDKTGIAVRNVEGNQHVKVPFELDIKKVAGQAIYKGVPIVGDGTTSTTTAPVLTKLHQDSEIKKLAEVTEVKKLTELTEVKKVTQIPDVVIDSMPNVVISGTPNVNVANSPTVTVDNMPSEPIEVEGTVSVSNMPSEPIEIEGTVTVNPSE